jgi:rhodanese-related sulfurtransferase/DNA-binding transcriptional ArsR family regulator
MGTQATDRALKDTLFEQFARIGRALGSPKRLELLDLLAQGERSVDALAGLTGMSLTNTSAHLQVLARARLVATRRQATRVLYRLADDRVARLVGELRALAHARLAEVDQALRAYLDGPSDPEPVTRAELAARLRRGDVVVLDVRPAEEYAAGHIPGAVSVPIERLEAEIGRLPRDGEIVAYCRGPYCLYAPSAVRLLRERGFAARRLEDGLPEWRLAGLPVTTTPAA